MFILIQYKIKKELPRDNSLIFSVQTGKRGVFISDIVCDLFYHLYKIGTFYLGVLVAQLDFHNRLVVPKRLDVYFEIEVIACQAVAVLTDLPLRGVRVHEQSQILVL